MFVMLVKIILEFDQLMFDEELGPHVKLEVRSSTGLVQPCWLYKDSNLGVQTRGSICMSDLHSLVFRIHRIYSMYC